MVTLGLLDTDDSLSWGKVVSSLVNISSSISSGKSDKSVDSAVETLVEFAVFIKEFLNSNFTQDNTTLIEIKHWAGKTYPGST